MTLVRGGFRGGSGGSGPPGPPGPQGAKGDKGDPGTSPHVDIATGNWFVGNTDTGIHAQGPPGTGGGGGGGPTVLWFSRSGQLSVDGPSGGSMPILIPEDSTISAVRAAIGIPSAGAAVIADVVDDTGTSVLGGTPLTVPVAVKLSNLVSPNHFVAAFTILHLKMVQIGSDSNGRGQDLNVAVVLA